MSTPQMCRWHYRLRHNPYHPYARGRSPALLLRSSLAVLQRDSSTLRAAIEDFIEYTLIPIYTDPIGYAQDCRDLPTMETSLDHDEQSFLLMTCVLVFVSDLDARTPAPWTLTQTYLGRRVKELAAELDDPVEGTEAGAVRAELGCYWTGLARAIERIRADLDAHQWPDPRACAVVSDAFSSVGSTELSTGVACRVWQALADGGAASLFWAFMFAAARRACERTVSSSQGGRGAMECVADDIARPVARLWGVELPYRSPRGNYGRPLSDARRAVFRGPEWSWARLNCAWNHATHASLEEFAGLALVC